MTSHYEFLGGQGGHNSTHKKRQADIKNRKRGTLQSWSDIVSTFLGFNEKLEWISPKDLYRPLLLHTVYEENILSKSSLFNSVTQLCPTLCDTMDCSTPGFPVHHKLPELAQTHVHQVGDAIQPSHPLSSLSPPALNLSQHQGLFKWVSSSHQVAKVLEFQLQHQSFRWTSRTGVL